MNTAQIFMLAGLRMKRVFLYFVVLAFLWPCSTSGTDRRKNSFSVGLSTGYSNHLSKTTYTDAVSSATVTVEDKNRNEHGINAGLTLTWRRSLSRLFSFDLSALTQLSTPGPYYEHSITPRLRYTPSSKNLAVFGGLPVTVAGKSLFTDKLFLIFGVAAGMEFYLDTKWIAGFSLDINVVNPVAVKSSEIINGTTYTTKERLDSIMLRLFIEYRF